MLGGLSHVSVANLKCCRDRARLDRLADCGHVRNAHYIPIQSRSVGHHCYRTFVWSGFRGDGYIVILFFAKLLQNWRLTEVVTTRCFTSKWRDEIPDVSEVLSRGWNSVP